MGGVDAFDEYFVVNGEFEGRVLVVGGGAVCVGFAVEQGADFASVLRGRYVETFLLFLLLVVIGYFEHATGGVPFFEEPVVFPDGAQGSKFAVGGD